MVLAFFVGLVFEAAITIHTRLVASEKPRRLALFAWTVGITLVWGYVMRELVLDASLIPVYSVAAGLGVVAASFLGRRHEIQSTSEYSSKGPAKDHDLRAEDLSSNPWE